MTTIQLTPNVIALAHAVTASTPAPSSFIERPVSDAAVGDSYRYVPESGTPRTGTIASIAPAGRYDRTQVIFGIDGVKKDSRGNNRTHFVRHEVSGTFLGTI